MVSLRSVQLSDAVFMARLHKECFPTSGWEASQMEGSLHLETTRGWIAEEEGIIQGFLLAQFVANEAEILTFCVQPASRHRGIGRLLLRALMAETPKEGIHLDVAEDNTVARALYKSVGFVACGQRTGYYFRGDHRVNAINYSYHSNR